MWDSISTIVASIALIVSIATFFKNYSWQRKRATLEAYRKLEGDIFIFYFYQENELEEDLLDPSSDNYKNLSAALASIEQFAICTFNNTFDKKLVYDLSKEYLGNTLRNKIEMAYDVKKSYRKKDYYPNTRKLLDWIDEKSKNRAK